MYILGTYIYVPIRDYSEVNNSKAGLRFMQDDTKLTLINFIF